MASSYTYAFFHCYYGFQNFPFFCVTLCVLHALQNATPSHSAEHATHTGWSKERGILKCVVAVKECVRRGGRNLQDVIFKHWKFGLLSLKRQVVMVQFLSINFFLDFFNFCWVFQKIPFFVSLCIWGLVVNATPSPLYSRVRYLLPILLEAGWVTQHLQEINIHVPRRNSNS